MHKQYKLEINFDTENELFSLLEKIKNNNDISECVREIPQNRRQSSNKNKPWSDYEDSIIITEYKKHPAKWIGLSLGRTTQSINQRIVKLRKEMKIVTHKTNRNSSVKLV